jgi:integrase
MARYPSDTLLSPEGILAMSSPKVLTVARIEAAKPREARYELPDAGLPGFYLIVQPSGYKSFALRYRVAAKPKKFTIGAFPKLSLEAARKLAREAAVAVARGEDPGAEKKAAKAKRQPTGVPQTIEALAALFMERYAKKNTRERSWQETERILNRDVLPAWKGRLLDSIRRRDVIALLDDIAGKHKVHANRVLAAVRRMFSWACERDILEASPCFGVKAPSQEVSRDRVLSDDELALVMRAASALETPFGPYVQMLALTLQRRNEVSGMKWRELDLANTTWTLPASRTKNANEHIVPLSAAAMHILETLKTERFAGSDYVFTTTGKSPISGFAKLKKQIDKLITAENGGEPIAPWRFHDLRRSGASKMPRLGVTLPVVEKILNHTSGSFAGVVGVYQRHDFQDEKRAALEAWASFLGRLTEGGGDNVANLGEHRATCQAVLK